MYVTTQSQRFANKCIARSSHKNSKHSATPPGPELGTIVRRSFLEPTTTNPLAAPRARGATNLGGWAIRRPIVGASSQEASESAPPTNTAQTSEWLAQQGAGCRLSGNSDEARRLLGQAIRLQRDNWFAILNLAAMTIGRIDAHIEFKILKLALKADPNNQFALFCLGTYHWCHSTIGEAIGAFEKLLAVNPDHDQAAASISYILLGQGDRNKALSYACKSLQTNPFNTTALRVLQILDFPGWTEMYTNNGCNLPVSSLFGPESILERVVLW